MSTIIFSKQITITFLALRGECTFFIHKPAVGVYIMPVFPSLDGLPWVLQVTLPVQILTLHCHRSLIC